MVNKLRNDLESNRDKVVMLVNMINALIMPRCWIGIDERGWLHLTRLTGESGTDIRIPTVLTYNADVMWDYVVCDQKYTCTKSRYDEPPVGTVLGTVPV
jgi:hypothetical protein